MKRTAEAIWIGSGKDGHGTVSTQSGVVKGSQYSFKSRFEEGIGTNPEELIAAAHAGCFAMKLSFNLSGAGFVPESLNVKCAISLVDGVISNSDLTLEAKVPGIAKEKFDELVADAEKNCPVSKVLNLKISVSATLV